MTTQNKPCICEILGVEVGEEFEIAGKNNGLVHINSGGYLEDSGRRVVVGSWTLSHIINHPEDIIRKPQFTPSDIELLSHIRAIFGNGRIWRSTTGALWFTREKTNFELPRDLFQSIKNQSDIVRIDQVLKEGDPNEKAKT